MRCWTLIVIVALSSTAQAEEWNPLAWTGAWYAPGAVRARALWVEEGRLRLQLPHGESATRNLSAPVALPPDGILTFVGGKIRLSLEPLSADRLQARWIEGGLRRREIWHRSSAPTLEVIGSKTLRRRAGSGVRLQVRVGGRTQRLVVEIRVRSTTSGGPPASRYAKLRGLVHYEERTLPVGRSVITWTGKDRSVAERPLQPGAYDLLVRSAGAILRPKAEGAEARVRLIVTGRRPTPRPRASAAKDLPLVDPRVGRPLSGRPVWQAPRARRAPPRAVAAPDQPRSATKGRGRLSRVGARSGMIRPPRAKRAR